MHEYENFTKIQKRVLIFLFNYRHKVENKINDLAALPQDTAVNNI